MSARETPLVDALEEMRLRAEAAEARIASVSGVTREELAKREYERGLAEGKALRAFVEGVAQMATENEMRGGMTSEDAIATVNGLIEGARALLIIAKGGT